MYPRKSGSYACPELTEGSLFSRAWEPDLRDIPIQYVLIQSIYYSRGGSHTAVVVGRESSAFNKCHTERVFLLASEDLGC